MGIRFYCPDCGRKLNIKEFLAGKLGICPYCDARVRIPLVSQLPEGAPKYRPVGATVSVATSAMVAEPDHADQPASQMAPAWSDPIAENPDALWYVRIPSGDEFGPARGEIMRRWLNEGRVGPDSLVWREGWTDWKLAGPVFPELTSHAFRVQTAPVTARLAEAPQASSPVRPQLNPTSVATAAEMRRATARRKSLVPVIGLGLLIIALLVVTVVVLTR